MSLPERTLRLDDSSCAWRLLRLSQALAALPRGARLKVESSDPGLNVDLQALLRQTGHSIVSLDLRADSLEVVVIRD